MRSSTVFSVIFVFALAAFLATSQYSPKEPEIIVQNNSIEPPGLPDAGIDKSTSSMAQNVFEGDIVSPITPAPVYAQSEANLYAPDQIRAIYLTGCVAGSPVWRKEIIPMMRDLNLNAVIFDIKDYSGYVSYKMPELEEVIGSGADTKTCIRNIDEVLREFHSNNIYVIGRITVFQDPVFARTHPELALKNNLTGALWKDNKGLEWLDPASESVWTYVESISMDALARGFDEVNFDYIRFPSDGPLSLASYPFYSGTESKTSVMSRFFLHLRNSLKGEIISADLFGLTVSASDDMGIGQTLNIAFPNFDYISPMIYPSHFASGYKGFISPAEEPYGVIKSAMQDGLLKRQYFMQNNPGVKAAEFRPWLQAFNLGAVYDKFKIDAQVRGVEEAFIGSEDILNGWMFWDPSNLYKGLLNLY